MVDDGVDHDAVGLGKFGDIVPAAEARVDLGVVDGVEACIRAVEWSEERQDMHAVIHAVETGAQNVGHRAEGAVAEAIGVGDELHFVFHGTSLGSWARVQFACASACLLFTYLHTHVCIEPVRYYLERDVNVQSRSEMRVSNRFDAVFYAASLSDSNVSDSAESDTQNTFSELRRPIQQNRTHMHKSDDEHDYRRASAGCERR